MKLNPDCMRDILLVMEDIPYDESLSFSKLSNELTSYNEDDLRDSCLKLYEAGFIEVLKRETNHGTLILKIRDITYTGHQFLADIRSDNVWSKTKGVLSKVGSNSVSTISQVASGILTLIIKSELGIT